MYCNTYFDATDSEAPKLELEEEESVNTIDSTSLNSVLAHLSMFLETKSMLEEIVEKSSHILLTSELKISC